MIHPKQLVAHRGYQARYPENTALSLNKAITAGAYFIELDVQFSLDQLPIIYHDTNLRRVSGADVEIAKTSREQLLKYPAYEPERLGEQFIEELISPLESLVEILQSHPQVTAFVELKDESIVHCGREIISESVHSILQPVMSQVVIMSFDYQLAVAAREAEWPLVGVVLRNWTDLDHPLVSRARPDYIYVDHSIVPADFDRDSTQQLNNCKLVTYEVGNNQLAQELLRRGADMLETFEIAQLIA
ncbi:MAG: glycerophosphodiester phosphodiesterase family protein [Porticoccaceae bacterium]|nr:glycerophosphodiester phosphodiesterase family protein [Porticoccaceae bacterium]